ncbi:uncharacterized protein BBA_06657 [Beauveria bassiana ARSEF 2860]|uniref:DNA recombination and repair protein Rad51-like C-terminal domain-containing protein n=1 Tax=Beauveria bassiana (strain ARSEF 2860) TaxID=655819 RepID=J4W1C7_BEAB2|nr:uncharacterized protein BBA_06657 [Beauveria bassiana ARSEF 2860]EJP64275.1 hypothetical protein BBA_06657 [Beauveria bassiana ARSEF 2860]
MPPPPAAPPPSTSSSYPRTPSSSSRIPPRLEAYVASGPLARDEGSLTVVTAVQGASANWLLLRYLYALLAGGVGGGGGGGSRGVEERGVIGVVLGMDLNALCKNGRFAFVDGLTGLCAPVVPGSSNGIIVGGGATTTTTASTTDSDNVVKACVDTAAARLTAGSRTVLLVDGLDAYVATGSGSGAAGAASLIMSLRENVHSTLVTLAADEPLVHMQAAAQTTKLEREQAALVLGQAHAADQVVSLRRLDTGAAADVSGVLRVVVGPAATAANYGDGDEGEELLYHVAGDGSVRVFERGA